MSGIEVFLDDSPGEVRGVIARDGRFERLIIQREDAPPTQCLGARVVGRVIEAAPAFRAAFIDLGDGGPAGFLPLGKGETARTGEVMTVEVTAEPREAKGAALRRIGPGEGPARLIAPGPSVAEQLGRLAPGIAVITGVEAIRASLEAEEAALAMGDVFPEWALDLAVQRTRALIAVDIDHAAQPGRDARRGRAEANRRGLEQAARLIRLKGWGGLVAIDLVGTALDPAEVSGLAKTAFAGDGAAVGPLSRFGLLQLALPWRSRPVEEVLNDGAGRRTPVTLAIHVVRHLRLALLSDTRAPRIFAHCAPETAALVAALAARLGPRAAIRPDPGLVPGRFVISED